MTGTRALRRIFCICVVCLAVFQFSENTADPDLWGHVLFGEHFLKTGSLMRVEPYSWTASGHEWINHEVLAEIALGAAHRWLGGAGLLLLKLAVGLLTFAIALSISIRQMSPATRAVAWAFGALAVVEISFGFAARPQIFSALALAAQFWMVREIHRGRRVWLFALPPLFALWINTHGGVLLGIALLWVTAATITAQRWLKPFAPDSIRARLDAPLPATTIVWFAISTVFATVAMLANPYGAGLLRWLADSVLWTQRDIGEWNPATLGWDHGAFFFCATLTAVAFLLSRRPFTLWEITVTVLLGAMAFRSARNTPLFCIAALAFVPPHLADVLERFRQQFRRFEELGQNPAVQKLLTAALALITAGMIAATFTLHKDNPWTMEAPRAQYPVAAIQFTRDHGLHGNLLNFFDWGEMCIWELPDSRVSIDGRLDTCYPRDLITAHWNFYNAQPVDKAVLDIGQADFAILPASLAGGFTLAKQDHWQPVYVDNLAVVLVKNPAQFPKLAGLTLPVQGGPEATQGRAAFPQSPSSRLGP